MPKIDANDIAAAGGVEALRLANANAEAGAKAEALTDFPTIAEMSVKYGKDQREPIIDGLLRRGEIANIIAPAKKGKSWLSYNLALCQAAGAPLFGVRKWGCRAGTTVIFDNELHPETLAFRVPHVRQQLGMNDSIDNAVRCVSMRGLGLDIDSLGPYFAKAAILKPKLIILDSLYRFIPKGCDENSNADMTIIYNKLDRYLTMVKTAALVLILHTSKGDQSQKALMDLAVGGGACGRAADVQIGLRDHAEPKHYVMEYEFRSWAHQQEKPLISLKYENCTFRNSGTEPIVRAPGGKSAERAMPTLQTFLDALAYDRPTPKAVVIQRIQDKTGMTVKDTETFILEIMTNDKLLNLEKDDAPRPGNGYVARKMPVGNIAFQRTRSTENEPKQE